MWTFSDTKVYGIFYDLGFPERVFKVGKGFVANIFKKRFPEKMVKDCGFNFLSLFELEKISKAFEKGTVHGYNILSWRLFGCKAQAV